MMLFWQIVIVFAFAGEMLVAIVVAALGWKDVRDLLRGLGTDGAPPPATGDGEHSPGLSPEGEKS